jgi:endoglucanase
MRAPIITFRGRRAAVVLLAAAALVSSVLTGAPRATSTPLPSNPLDSVPWGIWHAQGNDVWPDYEAAAAGSTQKQLLEKIAQRSRTRWFTSLNTTAEMQSKVHDYIADLQQQHGADVLAPIALFRQFPNHESHKADPWTRAMRRAYKSWYVAAAHGIGTARAMVILEPDLPVILKDAWRPDIRQRLVKFAATTLHQFAPNASVYIDAGSADWITPTAAAHLLQRSGVASIRGFALGGTHYDTTARNIAHGRQIVAKLAALGIPNKHFVIDTADNGHGFTFGEYRQRHPNGDPTNPVVCQTKAQQVCETLGIPPTWKVDDPQWHLPATAATTAHRWVDAYVWYNRPWLDHASSPFVLERALDLARTTPFAMCTTPC